MKYVVHLFAQIRLKVSGVVADSMAQAMMKADTAVQSYHTQSRDNPLCHFTDGSRIEYTDHAQDYAECAFVESRPRKIGQGDK